MAAMTRTGMKRLSIKKEGFELELERSESGAFKQFDVPIDFGEELPIRSEVGLKKTSAALSRATSESTTTLAHPVELNKEKVEHPGHFVTSPMVGTYYSQPSPEDPPFVKIGDKIDKNTVVCIIEAMKVMNEVKAGIAGTVVEVLVESGHPVEFGTKLFRIN